MDVNNLYFGLYNTRLIIYEPINPTYGHLVCILTTVSQTYGEDKPVVRLPCMDYNKLKVVALYEEVL